MSSSNLPESDGIAVLSSSERRRTRRYPFSTAVEVTEIKSGAKMNGRTSDLGLGGCYVDTLNPLPIGTEVKVKILHGNEIFEAQAKVTFSKSAMGMGIAFVAAQPSQARTFRKWIEEISATTAPLAEPASGEPAPGGNSQTQSDAALSELILALMKKQILTDAEGRELLKKLFP